ncbi:S46 family peptidase [Fodinibius sp. AD559]|uniref:S46 family peptidase n=1 Tax=Fodinibius sp. AD559 TaxID=3424179 RepID=UPI004046A87A
MQQSALKKLCGSISTILLLLFLLGGCSSPANVQQSGSDRTSSERPQASADKTSDLSGLWLLPQIDGPVYRKLQSKGITLPQKEVYDPNSISLNQAIAKIKIGGSQAGTGSFVSLNGLVLTNYGSVIQGITQNSTLNQNYIHNGFAAESQEQELPLENYNLLITIEQKEVTDQINQKLPDSLTYRQQKKQKQQIEKQIIADRQSGNNNLVIEINDIWGGNRQFMSVYKVIRDVRLVHAPSNSNIEKSANYAFLRAYVGPNGQSRTYNKFNVPFQPQKHLTIANKEIAPNDVTLTLGFPGETQRYESSYAIKFYRNNRNPVLIDTYKTILDAAQYAAEQDSATAIENAPLRLSLNHNLTYYRAIQQGIDENNIIRRKQTDEDKFEKWIKKDSLHSIKYRRVLSQLEQSYTIASQTGDLLFALVNTINNSKLLQIAGLYNSYYEHISDTTNTKVNSAKKQEILQRHQNILSNINMEAQTMMLGDMLYMLATLPDGKIPFHLIKLFSDSQKDALKKEIESYLERQEKESIVYNLNRAKKFLNQSADSTHKHPKDNLVTLYGELLNSYQFSRKNYSQHVPYLRPAQELYVQGMLEFSNGSVPYPDANGTLRLSIGQVQTLQATENSKSVTKSVDDNTGMESFVITNDITGGSLGSPVLNSNGKLIGIVVERSPQSMINDLLFMPELTHTITMNIRPIISHITEMYNDSSLLREIQAQRDNE